MKFLLKHFCLPIITAATLVVTINAQQVSPSPTTAARPAASSVILRVGGEVARPLAMTAADFAKLPRLSVKAKDHGTDATFEGAALGEVLKLAGVEFGESLRGKLLETYLLVEAMDDYRAVYALTELDPAFTDRVILLADRRDGKPLSEKEGALRVVIPDENRAARWVRQVVRLTVRRDRQP